jgi:thiamine-phosphate pyrophosphorylase
MIPKLHYISEGNSPKEHIENIQKACSSGAELVQLHLKNISEKKHLKLAKEAREITSYFQTRLIIYEDFKIARTVKADGVHLETMAASSMKARIHLYTWQIIGGSANTLQDCETLIEKQVDYIILHPFRAAETKDNTALALGLNGYTVIIETLKTETPILGEGGIVTKDVTSILETGISGICVSEEITKDFDVIKKFNKLLSASSIDEKRHTFE